jgi:hypothetical protein
LYGVDGVNARSTSEYGGVGGAKAYGPSTKDGNGVSRLEARLGDTRPKSEEDVGIEEVVDEG